MASIYLVASSVSAVQKLFNVKTNYITHGWVLPALRAFLCLKFACGKLLNGNIMFTVLCYIAWGSAGVFYSKQRLAN